MLKSISYDQLNVGDFYEITQQISFDDILSFSKISGDVNPIHIDLEFAKSTKFGKPIAHGILVASYIPQVLGTKFPGVGCIYLQQKVDFLAPVFAEDELVIRVSVVNKLDKGRVVLENNIFNQNKLLVLTGSSLVIAPREANNVKVAHE